MSGVGLQLGSSTTVGVVEGVACDDALPEAVEPQAGGGHGDARLVEVLEPGVLGDDA